MKTNDITKRVKTDVKPQKNESQKNSTFETYKTYDLNFVSFIVLLISIYKFKKDT